MVTGRHPWASRLCRTPRTNLGTAVRRWGWLTYLGLGRAPHPAAGLLVSIQLEGKEEAWQHSDPNDSSTFCPPPPQGPSPPADTEGRAENTATECGQSGFQTQARPGLRPTSCPPWPPEGHMGLQAPGWAVGKVRLIGDMGRTTTEGLQWLEESQTAPEVVLRTGQRW